MKTLRGARARYRCGRCGSIHSWYSCLLFPGLFTGEQHHSRLVDSMMLMRCVLVCICVCIDRSPGRGGHPPHGTHIHAATTTPLPPLPPPAAHKSARGGPTLTGRRALHPSDRAGSVDERAMGAGPCPRRLCARRRHAQYGGVWLKQQRRGGARLE